MIPFNEIKAELEKEITKFEKEHKSVDEEGNTDCMIMNNNIYRVASKREWLGTEKSRQEALEHQKMMDKCINCYVCEFIQELKSLLGEKK